MDVPLLFAGLLALVAAAVHGVAGELLVVRELRQAPLPRTRFGGQRMTRAMVHVSWHITTSAFLAVGAGMIVAAAALDGDAAQSLALFCAASFTAFAAVTVMLDTAGATPRALLRHPGPVVLSATTALAWWGAL